MNGDPCPSSAADLAARLEEALREGDPKTVKALIEAGADVRYKREHGYDALLDAVHGRHMARDSLLLELLALLVAHGVDLSGVSSYGESGLRVLSMVGRFDGVRLLLEAGADRSHLKWTPLHSAVALGSRGDVKAALDQGEALEERDWWSRTSWMMALLTGDIARADLLRERGADTNARGHCGFPSLFYAIEGHHPEMVRWLLASGANVHEPDDFGATPLIKSVEVDDLECVDILLNAGADVAVDANGTALSCASSREVILRLLEAGADPADANQRAVLGLQGTREEVLAAVTPEEFRATCGRKFGRANPERMNIKFWEAMIRCGDAAYRARKKFEDQCGDVPGPVWCAERFGQSLTLLPDGRAIQIAGEHEDWNFPDFCIYNDVFVHERDGSVAIFGYPRRVFPPTDFHTATLIGEYIYLIGSLGYPRARKYGETPAFRLNVNTLQMKRLHPGGDGPGWIFKHQAALLPANRIRVWGGEVATEGEDGESNDRNPDAFVLDVDRLCWSRVPCQT